MEKYFKMTKESLAALADKVSGKLRTSGDTLEVIPASRPHQPATGLERILGDLVEMPTVSGDYESNHEAIEYIDRFLSERALHVMRFEQNGFESLVATTRHTKTPKVLLAAHTDVVPGPAELFRLRKKQGRLYGRGVFDMKYAIAAYLQLVDDLNDHLNDYDFGIMITTDEEIGGFDGTNLILRQGYKPDVAILPDCGDNPNNWKLERSAKSILELGIKTHGKNAHGSRPWKGDNAIDKLTALLDEIRQLFPEPGPKTNTLNIGLLHGGKVPNQVPDEAYTELDIRTTDNTEAERLKKAIDVICSKYKADLNPLFPYGHACFTDVNNPLVKEFVRCVKKVVKDIPLVETDSTGASDARFFSEAGIPCIVAGPIGDGFHASDEWVSEDGLHQLHQVLTEYVKKVAKAGGPSASPQVTENLSKKLK